MTQFSRSQLEPTHEAPTRPPSTVRLEYRGSRIHGERFAFRLDSTQTRISVAAAQVSFEISVAAAQIYVAAALVSYLTP